MLFNIKKFPVLASTNKYAAEAAQNGAEEGTVIVAVEQTAGRGRQGRNWFSQKGTCLCFSIILRPAIEPVKAMTLPLVAGLSVAEALREETGCEEIKIKWPNDILADGKKICGILCESQISGAAIGHIITGIGININTETKNLPEEIRNTATSLYELDGAKRNSDKVLQNVLNHFEKYYDEWLLYGFAAILPKLEPLNYLLGKKITIELTKEKTTGTVCGISPDGALLLQADYATEAVYSGEAHIIPG